MQQETQSITSKRTQFAILNSQKLSKLPEKEAGRIIKNIREIERHLRKQQLSGNIVFGDCTQQKINQCFVYIREWAITSLSVFLCQCSTVQLVGCSGWILKPKSPFFNIFHIKFTNLRKLSLSYRKVTNLQPMQYPQSFSLLQNLSFSTCDFDSMSTLLFFPLHQLKRLSLNQNSIESVSFLRDIDFPQLGILSLANNSLQHSSELGNLSLPVVEILDLRGNKLESLNFISVNKFQRLKILNLYQNQITSMESLAQADLSHLQMLNLNKNKISSIRSLRRLSLPNIKEISVAGNLILEFNPVVELHFQGASVFFYTLDNCQATGALAKMPIYIDTNFEDTKNTSMKPDRFIQFFGQFSKPLYGNFSQTYKILSQKNFQNVEKKLLNDNQCF